MISAEAMDRLDKKLARMAHAKRMYERNKESTEARIDTMSIEECYQMCKQQDRLYLIGSGER